MESFELMRLTVGAVDTAVLTAGFRRAARVPARRRNGGRIRLLPSARGALPARRAIPPRLRALGRSHRDRQRRRLRAALCRPLCRARNRQARAVRALMGWLGRNHVRGSPPEAACVGSCSPRPTGSIAPEHLLANIPAMSPDQILASLTKDPTVFAGKVPVPLDEQFVAAQQRELQSAGRVMPGPFDPTLERKLADVPRRSSSSGETTTRSSRSSMPRCGTNRCRTAPCSCSPAEAIFSSTRSPRPWPRCWPSPESFRDHRRSRAHDAFVAPRARPDARRR